MQNGDAQYERLTKIKYMEEAKVNGSKDTARAIMMITVVNGRTLFAEVE